VEHYAHLFHDGNGSAGTVHGVTATTDDVVCLAAQWIHEGRRVDLRALAAELGVSRTTLHRRVGNREALLGRALWVMAEEAMRRVDSDLGANPEGAAPHRRHAAAAITRFNRAVATNPGLRRFIDEEPRTAVRVLTDARGFIQPRIVAAVEELLRRDLDGRDDPPFARADQLAYALVRLSETFLYADVIADRAPDVETANRLASALIDSWLASAP
jgi:AcrR family transcriptional regulator